MSLTNFVTLFFVIGGSSCFPQGVLNTNPDGSINVVGKFPLNGQNGDKNLLSAVAGIDGMKNSEFSAANAGMSLENIAGKGHSLSLTERHMPAFGDQLTAAGSLNLLDKGPHRVDAGAFVTRNIPKNPNFDSFTSGGGSLGYNYGGKLGATLSASNLGYSAMADANLLRGRDYSLDLRAGVSRSIGPYMPETRWQPSGSIMFSKYF
nr:attacin [Dioryctria sylvestrella]